MSTIPTIRSVIPRSALPRPAVVRSQRSSSITVSTAATLHSVASSSLSPSPSPAPVHRLRSSLADLSISKPKRTGDVSRLYVSIVMGIPTVLHTLAVVRAIEEKFGRVLDIQQMRHSDIPVSKNFFFVDLLNSIPKSTFSAGDINLELPIPSSYHNTTSLLGGPSFSDIDSVLYGDINPTQTSRTLKPNHTELMLVTIQAAAERKSEKNQYNYRTNQKWRRISKKQTEIEKEEDEQIGIALGGFHGFYGGFEPLQRQFKRMAQGNIEQVNELEQPVVVVEEGEGEEVEEVEEAAVPSSLVEAWKERRTQMSPQIKDGDEAAVEKIGSNPVKKNSILSNIKNEHTSKVSSTSSSFAKPIIITTSQQETPSPISSNSVDGRPAQRHRPITSQRQEWYNRTVERQRQRIEETERRAVDARPSIFSRSKPKAKNIKVEQRQQHQTEEDGGLLTGFRSWLGGSGLKKH